jgi:multidrug resistance efflux pump
VDIVRKGAGKRRLIQRIVIGLVLLGGVAGAAVYFNKLKPAVPTVERSTIWPDTVKKGDMLRQVRGPGTLVPEDVLWIPAPVDGRIVKINVLAGAAMKPDTVILELENPDVMLDAVKAEFDLKAAEADLTNLRVTLASTTFDKKAAAATVNSDYVQAKLAADRDKQLEKAGLVPDLTMQLSSTKAAELATRNEIEESRLKIIDQSTVAQIEAQKVKVEQFRAIYELKKKQVDELHVRAGYNGILQQLGASAAAGSSTTAPPLEVGQKVLAGTILAKIAQPQKLKADLKITETEAKDIALGQPAEIDTRNGVIPGKVIRIDPASVNGTVTVDVQLLGALPQGARPDLSVDGTIELEKLHDVLYISRPVFGQPNSDATIFLIGPDGKTCVRTKVRFGKASVNAIEVVGGLRLGDQVILSDMNQWENHNEIKLN